MRFKRKISDKQIEYIIAHPQMSNKELADKFRVKTDDIGNYKSRLRKMGIDIPRNIKPVMGIAKIVNKYKN